VRRSTPNAANSFADYKQANGEWESRNADVVRKRSG
jgi:hypothetical protein